MTKTTLVAYFSLTETTANLANLIASLAQADLFEIKPKQPYEKADLDWQNKESRTSKEHEDPNCRPAIDGKVSNFEQYNTIYIGFPLWWYTAPRIINTFLDEYDFTGKKVIPFATSLGSQIDKADSDLIEACKTKPTWVPGKRFGTTDTDIMTVKNWIDSI